MKLRECPTPKILAAPQALQLRQMGVAAVSLALISALKGAWRKVKGHKEHASSSTFKEFLFSLLSNMCLYCLDKLRNSRFLLVGQLCLHLTTNKCFVKLGEWMGVESSSCLFIIMH